MNDADGARPHARGVAMARRLRRNATDAEQLLWRQLRRRQLGGAHFRRQVPIGPYVVDFLCRPARLVVELDGGQHADRAAHDAARTSWLEARGYRVLRFWNNDVLSNPVGVLEVLREALIAAGFPSDPPDPLPDPPPEGRG